MKKSDALTAVGLAGGILVLVYAMMMGGQGLGMFWDISSVLITIGGSLAAVMITLPLSTFKKIGVVFMQAFKEKQGSGQEIISQFSDLSKKARREGLLSLEDEITQLEDNFLKKGLQMVVDGIEPETIREILEKYLNLKLEKWKLGMQMELLFLRYGVIMLLGLGC